jgi:iron complex outermembrane receptor protein
LSTGELSSPATPALPTRIWRLLLVLILTVAPGWASNPGEREARDLTQISLEELMNIEVTSVSRKEQKLSQTAAAVYVVTQEDIRRSGVTNIPEVLRMVPGLQVARIDSNKWAISSRGFNGRFANKMLVLIDGRSIYTSLYSGVYWDQYDVLLEDVERIEVIRGPGATMWGANAVNGVINIITKSAKDTQGTLITTGTGNEDKASVAVRHGGKHGDKVYYRTYTKYFNRSHLLTESGQAAHDNWDSARSGGRLDWEISDRDFLTIHGDLFKGESRQTIYPNYPVTLWGPPVKDSVGSSGGYALARWERRFSDRSDMALQCYFNDESRNEGFGRGVLRTLDFDFQHRVAASSRHDLMWGLGYRLVASHIGGGKASFVPSSRTDNLYSTFLQDDIFLVGDRLMLTVGSKFQHNAYSGSEIQPGVRLLWTPNSRQGLWGAVSRAVRTPSRFDHDLRLDFQMPPDIAPGVIGRLMGSKDFQSEAVVSYEAGYRHQLTSRFAVDFAGFYSVYDRLLTFEQRSLFFDMTHYTWLRLLQDKEVFNPGAPVLNEEGDIPRHQLQFRSNLDVTPTVSFDTAVYYVSALPAIDIPSYVRLDTRFGWRFTKQTEMSIGLQNLLDDRHPEFRPEDYSVISEAKRSAYVKLTWRF